jgi:hypothetical protein
MVAMKNIAIGGNLWGLAAQRLSLIFFYMDKQTRIYSFEF